MFPLILKPGEAKSVTLVSIGGKKVIRGGNSIVDGPVHAVQIENIMEAVRANGFGHEEYPEARLGFFMGVANYPVFVYLI